MRVAPLSLLLAGSVMGCSSAGDLSGGGQGTPPPSVTPAPSPIPSATPGSGSGCITSPALGDAVIPCNGLSYDVHVPAGCLSGCGLVLDVHGMSENGLMENDNDGMRALGDQYGYLVIQPNAAGSPPATVWYPVPDYDHVYSFLTEAITAYQVDPNRVHMMGFSMGGTMTFAFICAHADVLASAAPGSAHLLSCTFSGSQTPSRQLPVLQMHGTQDPVVSFTGTAIPQRDDLLAGWNMGPGTVIASDSTFTRTRYVSARGTVFEFIQHDYASPISILAGHCYPGSTDPGNVPGQLMPFGCAPTDSFDWGVEAMKFFIAHPRS